MTATTTRKYLTTTALILVGALLCTGFAAWDNAVVNASRKPLCQTTVHTVHVAHPAYNQAKPMARPLVQVKDKRGNLLEYYMDVESVACGDGKCEIVTVRIFWDTLGQFKRYLLPAGGTLTKKDHQVFSMEDHLKLHSILSDRASSLQYVSMDQIIAPDQAIQEVDALTGATPLAQQDSVVPGAVYTTFTLWHWANGTVSQAVCALTEKTCSNDQLSVYLNTGTEPFQIFAIKQFAKRRIHDRAALEDVIRQTEKGSASLVEPALAYFKGMATDTQANAYYNAVAALFSSGSEQKRIRYLDSLAATNQPPPPGYFDRLSATLSELETYYQVHRLLNLLEERNPSSPEVTQQVLLLLDKPQFFIARRAYYYLKDQTLSTEQHQRLEAFRLRFQDRL